METNQIDEQQWQQMSASEKKEFLKEQIDSDYKLIPLSEITDEARMIAVRWMECEDKMWIENKHKLASDIMNYARRHTAAKEDKAGMKEIYDAMMDSNKSSKTFPVESISATNRAKIFEWFKPYLFPSPSSQSEDIAVGFAKKILNPPDEVITNILRNYFSRGLTGDEYDESANKEVVDKVVDSHITTIKYFLLLYQVHLEFNPPEFKSLNITDQPLPDGGKAIDWDLLEERFFEFMGGKLLDLSIEELTEINTAIFNWFRTRPEFQQGWFTEQDMRNLIDYYRAEPFLNLYKTEAILERYLQSLTPSPETKP